MTFVSIKYLYHDILVSKSWPSVKEPLKWKYLVLHWLLQGTNEILRLYIALTCMQYVGLQMTDMIKYVHYENIAHLPVLPN